MLRVWLCSFHLFVGLVCVGCGGKDATVSGTVTLDGKPLPNATISFTPKGGGRPSMAVTDGDGDYELRYTGKVKGAEVGEYIVTISTLQESDGKVTTPEKVPAKYNVDSTLVKTVESGSNEINFDLDGSGRIAVPGRGGERVLPPDTCE